MRRHPEYCSCPKNVTVIALSHTGCAPIVRAVDDILGGELERLAKMPRHILFWEEEGQWLATSLTSAQQLTEWRVELFGNGLCPPWLQMDSMI